MVRDLKQSKNIINFSKRMVVILILLFFWETLARLGLINIKVLSSPLEIFYGIYQLLISGNLLIDIMQSIKRVLIGVALGTIVAVLFSLILGLSKKAYEYLGFLLEIFRPIPPIAWIPIAILWFGIGDAPAYFLVSLGAFFPVFTNTTIAIKSIERKYIDIARSLGASNFMVFLKVIIPLLLPDFISGFRIGLGVGWIIVITAEMVGAQNGLGYMIQLNRIMLQTPNVLIGMIVIGIIGLLLSILMNVIENMIIPWKRRIATIEK